MKTLSAIPEPTVSSDLSSLYQLVNQVTDSYSPAAQRHKSFIVNDVPESIFVSYNQDLFASVLSGLMKVVIMHTENSCIRITAKCYGDLVLLHIKDDGCVNYDSISQHLTRIQSLAERLRGFIGFTSYRNRLTTIAFSFMNKPELDSMN